MSAPHFFGIRHLSPTAAFHVHTLLDQLKPELVLIEGPSDLNKQMAWLCHTETVYPVAILAYTKSQPVHSILYPFAIYSPEVQAILWAHKRGIACRFMDLPSSVFLALGEPKTTPNSSNNEDNDKLPLNTEQALYRLEQISGEDHDSFWERNYEHIADAQQYAQATAAFGRELRSSVNDSSVRKAEIIIRESYMKRIIAEAISEGYNPERIFCVCGAFHIEGLLQIAPMSDQELSSLPTVESAAALMPYSYYRLSDCSGYGAGNRAPHYFHLLWQALNGTGLQNLPYTYFASLVASHRKFGNNVSSAELIEAVRLAQTLAFMRGSNCPCMSDLRDAAITSFGHGKFSELALAFADVEIGTTIGFLPEGGGRTSIQDDFYRQLQDLKLERFRTAETQPLNLDLRENLKVKSKSSAFLDLRRSFFLHRLRILSIPFASISSKKQDQANWGEYWQLRWTPDAEIELAEASLLGDTIEKAAVKVLSELASKSSSIADTAKLLQEAFWGGLPEAFKHVLSILQGLSIEAATVETVAKTAENLSLILRYGNLRQFNSEAVTPIIEQLYLKACLIMEESCSTDLFEPIMSAMEQINRLQLIHHFLNADMWINLLKRISLSSKLNACLAGFAMALLLERGIAEESVLECEVAKRLSPGMEAELGAGWFEGLAAKNRPALIMRLSLWKALDKYITQLDDRNFRRALVFLRRTFSRFSAQEKNDIAEHLGELWNLAKAAAELRREPDEQSKQLLQELEEFDFSDI
ncbi:MAG: DUF5682 family protein [Candidatus Bruticola sp.]